MARLVVQAPPLPALLTAGFEPKSRHQVWLVQNCGVIPGYPGSSWIQRLKEPLCISWSLYFRNEPLLKFTFDERNLVWQMGLRTFFLFQPFIFLSLMMYISFALNPCFGCSWGVDMMSARHKDRVLQEKIKRKPKTNEKEHNQARQRERERTQSIQCYTKSASLQRACAQHHPKGGARAPLDVDPKLQDGADSRNLGDVLVRFAKLFAQWCMHGAYSEYLHQNPCLVLQGFCIHRYLEF